MCVLILVYNMPGNETGSEFRGGPPAAHVHVPLLTCSPKYLCALEIRNALGRLIVDSGS